MMERLALVCAEAPHRCDAIPMSMLRRRQWREGFHFPNHLTRKRYWSALLQFFRALVQQDHDDDGILPTTDNNVNPESDSDDLDEDTG